MKKSTQQRSSAMQTTRRLFKVAPLALAVSLASMAVAPMAQATDLDVYKGADSSGSETSVMLVFDVSADMRLPDTKRILELYCTPKDGINWVLKNNKCVDNPKSWFPKTKEADYRYTHVVIPADTVPTVTTEFGSNDAAYDFERIAYKGENGTYYYRRIDKVKMSLYHIFDIQRMKNSSFKELDKKLAIGLSVTPNLDNDGKQKGDEGANANSVKGYILVPSHALDYKYPGEAIHDKVPIDDDIRRDNIRKTNLPIASSNYAGMTHRSRLHDAIQHINVDDRDLQNRGQFNPITFAYMETAAYLLGVSTNSPLGTNSDFQNNEHSGIRISADDVVKSTSVTIHPNETNGQPVSTHYETYIPPAAQGGTCSAGKGIFVLSSGPGFLSDEVNEFNNYIPVAQRIVGTTNYNGYLDCSAKDRNKADIGYISPGFIDTFTWIKTGSKQWYCPSALTRALRGWEYSHNAKYRAEPGKYGMFGQDYKQKGLVPSLQDKKLNILTGAIGFGSDMEVMAKLPKVEAYDYQGNKKMVTNCTKLGEKGYDKEYTSFCVFTEETYGFGEGGLYTGSNPEEVSNALNSFVNKLGGEVNIPPIATGTMSVPFDSLNQLTPRTDAYVPILDPKVGTEKLWDGNLKKYQIRNGTIVGELSKDSYQNVFTSRQGFFAKDTKDQWNTATTADEAMPQVGGAYSKILAGATATPVNTVERKTLIDVGNELKPLTVTAQAPTNFKNLNWNSANQVASDSTNKAEIEAKSGEERTKAIEARLQTMKQQLLNFLGYPANSTTVVADGTKLKKKVKDDSGNTTTVDVNQTQENRVLGGVLHSRPQLVTYDAVLNEDGSVASRKDYLLYGSFDGALHMLDDDTGEELFNFIPRQVLQRQGQAFSPETNKAFTDPTESPYLHGVDAEWTVFADYRRTAPELGKTGDYGIKAEKMFALGGLRMGGSMYYALDLTNKDDPKMLYSVGSDYALGVGKGSSYTATGEKNGSMQNSDSPYRRMGLTWAKPSVAYVKKGGKKVMVNLLPGGYDECYEDPHFQLNATDNEIGGCKSKTSAQGNAVYMVKVAQEEKEDGIAHLKTKGDDGVSGIGDVLWWASSDAPLGTNTDSKKVPDMKHSIVGEVLALDGNYDGLTDHLYFADLGGQVWRVDINNDASTDDFSIQRVVRVFDASDDAEQLTPKNSSTEYTYSPRIYDTPLVTFQRLGKQGKIYGLVTVGTGDRSNPLDETFSSNHIYTFIDKDLARYRTELFCKDDSNTPVDECAGISMYTEDVAPDDLSDISFDVKGVPDAIKVTAVKTAMENSINGETSGAAVAKAGWKYKLVDSGFTAELNKDMKDDPDTPTELKKPKGLKMLNRPDALNGILYTSIFSPEFSNKQKTEGEEEACTVSITGRTNRERLCLPYGYCFDDGETGTPVAVNRGTVLAGGGIVDNYVGYLGEGNDAEGRPQKSIGIIDTFCEGADCNRSENITKLGNVLGKDDVNRSFNPLQWFER